MTHHKTRSSRRPEAYVTLARLLGWFSIGLGLAELVAPRRTGRPVGMADRNGLLRSYGAREIATGAGLLLAKDPKRWVWGRVLGDALDVATLAAAGRAGRKNMAAAFAVLTVVGLVDFYCARRLSEGARPQPKQIPDYRGRSGFPRSPDEMRGAALRQQGR